MQNADKIRAFSSHARAVSAFAVLLLALSACTVRNFPVRPPMVETSRTVYSRGKAQEHFIRARDYERRGLGKMAEREYEKALQFDPESRVLKEQVIRKYIESGKYTQALLLIKQERKNEELNREEKRLVSTIYLKMEEIQRAARVLESVADKSPEDLYSLGLIYEMMGNIPKASGYYLQYLQRKSDALQIGFKVVKMFLHEKRFTEAESLLTVVGDSGGPPAEVYSLRGSSSALKGDTASALRWYDSALTIDSLHEESLRNKAQIFINRADFPPAIGCYEKMVIQSTLGEVYGRTLALLYYYNRQYAESERLLSRLIQSSMDDYELHYFLGLVFAATSRDGLAVLEFEKSLVLHMRNDDVWRELCSVFIRKKQFDKALEIAGRYTALLPEESLSWRLKGYVETLTRNYGSAVASFKRALEFDSLDTYTWFELGSALERNREFDKAVKVFRKVLKLHPDDPATLNYLGYMWAEQGKNLDTAKVFLRKALSKEPQNGAFLDSYAWIFFQLGECDSALIYLKKATERIYDDPILFHHLGDILSKLGDPEGALEAYRKSLELDTEEAPAIRRKIIDLEILRQSTCQPPR